MTKSTRMPAATHHQMLTRGRRGPPAGGAAFGSKPWPPFIRRGAGARASHRENSALAPLELLERGVRHLALRAIGELALLPFQIDEEHDDDDERCRAEADVDRRLQSFQRLAEVEVGEAERGRPHDPARGVEREKARPRHPVRPREERRIRAEDRDEAAEEHDLAAVPPEHPDTELEATVVDMELLSVP